MKSVITYLLILVSCVTLAYSASAQGRSKQVNAYGVQMSFRETQTRIQGVKLARNVLVISNHTKKLKKLNLTISIPAGWESYSKLEKAIKIKPGDTMYVPVRIKPHYSTKGDENYVVNAFLSNDKFTITNSVWYVSIEKKSDWQATALQNTIYFIEEDDSARFQLQLTNLGNSDEVLQVKCKRDKGLFFIDQFGKRVNADVIPISLKPDQDTILTYWVKRKKEDVRPETSGKHIIEEDDKRYFIKLTVVPERTNSGSLRRWTGSVEFLKLPDTKKVNESAFNSLPITFELDNYDLLSNSTFSSLNIYGNHYFKDRSNLTYYYQADFIQNQLNTRSFLGNYHYIAYRNRFMGIELGDISSGLTGSTLSGKGAKGEVKYKKHTLGGIYIQKPYLFDEFFASGYGSYYRFYHQKFNIDAFYQHEDNGLRKLKSDMGVANMSLRLIPGHSFVIGGGYSQENYSWDNNPVNATGYGGRFSYNGRVGKFGLGVNAFYGTPAYTPIRGSQSVSGILRYQLNSKHSFTLNGSIYNYNPHLFYSGSVNDSLFNNRMKYDFRYIYSEKKFSLIFQPSYYQYENNTFSSRTSGMFIEYRKKGRGTVNFHTTVFGGYSFFPQYPEVENIFVAHIRSTIRYKGLQASLRYYYGPYYSLDQIQYIETEENPQKLFSTLYYDFWFFKNSLRLNTNLNYNYSTLNKRHQVNTRPEITYYTKQNFQFSAYGRYILFAEGESTRSTYYQGSGAENAEVIEAAVSQNVEVGMGVKFNVNMPVGFARYYPVKVVAFKDINGNGIKDVNEDGIANMLISLKKVDQVSGDERMYNNTVDNIHDLVTNKNGEVEYRNVELGNYEITAQPLSPMGGWFDGKTFKRTIDKRKTVYIPLNKGARLSGGILLERGRFSRDKEVMLGNIRVTAINTDNGRTHVTLTDKNGQFVLYVPNGNYLVEINESAVPTRFQFMETSIPIMVTEDYDNYNVSYYLVEKERTARVKGKKRLPIKRTGSTEGGRKAIPEHDQNTYLDDPNYLPVVEPTEEGKYWVVQLYPENQPRHKVNQHDTLNDLTPVRCVQGEGVGFVYITKSFKKKRAAKKLLKKVVPRGYPRAKVVEMMFNANIVEPESKKEKKQENTQDSTVNVIKNYEEPAIEEPAKEEPKEEVKEEVKEETPAQEDTKTEVEVSPRIFEPIDTETERNYFRIEIKVSAEPLTSKDFDNLVPDTEKIYQIQQDGLYKYSVGRYATYTEAKNHQQLLQKDYDLKDSFVTQYKKSW